VRWHDFETAEPRFADLARDRLVGPGVVLVGTIRRDGSPRISPVEPFLLEGDLWLSMLWGSHKAVDLERDPRVLVHSIVTSRTGDEGEVKLRGRCRQESDPTTQQRYAEAVSAALGWRPEVGRFHLFAVDIASVAHVRYDEPTGDQHVVLWPTGEQFVRRGTSATSLGEPERSPSGLIGG
jgi:Pyridoxamine 5'-phosphate oxidase